MKLLVLAQTPPPLHGQSVMVRTVLDGLPAHGIAVHQVNLALSRDAADIGRWRPGKVFSVLGACVRAVAARFGQGCDTLYYVPAPAKRGALYRDWVVMLLCRPFFRRLVLHWHAAGLGAWLATNVTGPERWFTHLLLGRADLSIVLGESLRGDAQHLRPRRLAVVRNGISDPCPGFVRVPPRPDRVWREAVYLGLGSREKGLFAAAAGVIAANRTAGQGPRWRLTAAGDFPDPALAREFEALAAQADGAVRHVGFVTGDVKHELLAGAEALLFPTYYEAETQGLVVAEALAYDLPVVVTNWRAVAENLPSSHAHVVPAHAPAEIARALAEIAQSAPPAGTLRRHFLGHYTSDAFLASLASALREPAAAD